MDQAHIRNFTIIGHIDHGKSTLADRLLELTGTLTKREMRDQFLDQLTVERERGITVKLKSVRMRYTLHDQEYLLNLIDTPGHVDFSHEVSRSLPACEGALLIVDATQGVQAQTVANAYLALGYNLTLIPLVNKIDLFNADVAGTAKALVDTFGFTESEILPISAKEGTAIPLVLERLIERVPPPSGDPQAALTALIFDSHYDAHKGVVISIRVVDGMVQKEQHLLFMGSGAQAWALEVGVFQPGMVPKEHIQTGEVGYIATGLKDINRAQVGDTVTCVGRPAHITLAGYTQVKPMVYVGMYPVDPSDYILVREAIGKLKLSDAALSCVPESSRALGNGFRCGFLGLLHAEVTRERLEEEFGLDLIIATPNVAYRIEGVEVANPLEVEFSGKVVEEPWVKTVVYAPPEYVGSLMQLFTAYRGIAAGMDYLGKVVRLTYEMPLAELMVGFYDKLESVSSGYASLDYEFIGFIPVEAVRLDVLVNHEPVDALSQIAVREKAVAVGKNLVEKLKEAIPRQQFEVPIQAAIGGKIVARVDIPAFRKDVTAKLYGGDRTRKDKLLEAQKKGKKRLKSIGRIQIPQEAFFAVFRR